MPEPTAPPPRDLTTRFLRNAAGILLLVAGLTGLFLPILQGVLMIVGGLVLIDLPLKGRVNRWLLRYRWYQRLNGTHDRWLGRWREHRRRQDARRR